MLGKLAAFIILALQTYSFLINVIEQYTYDTDIFIENEQELRLNVNADVTITNAELKEISEKLFRNDANNVAHYVRLNIQQKVVSNSSEDFAPLRLLRVDPKIWDVCTITALKELYDNYYQSTNIEEMKTNQESKEENVFINEIMKTAVMTELMSFLSEKDLISSDANEQKNMMRQLWFHIYPRQRKLSSSAFEHIFLSEIRRKQILGLHNWIYFHTREESNDLNYLGYLKNVDLSDKASILKFRFNLGSLHKPVSSMFIGTSPELEMAYYTLCFLTRPQKKCKLSANNRKFSITTYLLNYDGKDFIGSAYPNL